MDLDGYGQFAVLGILPVGLWWVWERCLVCIYILDLDGYDKRWGFVIFTYWTWMVTVKGGVLVHSHNGITYLI